MEQIEECALAACTCVARAGDSYCSDYCRQAASHGTEKDFCQCAHESCAQMSRSARTGRVELPDSIQVMRDRVVIEYRSSEDLREQIVLLAGALDQGYGISRAVVELPSAARFPPSSERVSSVAKAGTA